MTSRNETKINDTKKFDIPLPISLGLLFKHMQNNNISESILRIVENINKLLFKYINQEKNNQKITELKLVYINNLVTEILYQKKNGKKSDNCSAKPRRYNYNLTSIENNKKFNTNPDIFEEINKSNMEINSNYLRLKLKKKIKSEHNKYKIKEMEYLQRISELQSELNSQEKNYEKLNSENNELINYINNLNSNQDKKMVKNNSAEALSFENLQIAKYIKIKNNNKKNENKKIRIHNSISNFYEKNRAKNLKRKIVDKYYKDTNSSAIDTYLNSNMNINSYNYKQHHHSTSLNDLNFRYQVGNNYLRENFYKLKKDIFAKTNHLKKIKNLLNDIK